MPSLNPSEETETSIEPQMNPRKLSCVDAVKFDGESLLSTVRVYHEVQPESWT